MSTVGNGTFFCLADHLERFADALLQLFLEADLHCFVNSPTRGVGVGRCLDAVFSNEVAKAVGG